MQNRNILMTNDEEIRTLRIPSATILWSGPYSLEEAAVKAGGGLYILVNKAGKPVYVGQTGSYKARFRSRIENLRQAACNLHSRTVYLGAIQLPKGGVQNSRLRRDLESVLIRWYLRRGHKLVNRSSVLGFIMGPRDALIINKGVSVPYLANKIALKRNERFELEAPENLQKYREGASDRFSSAEGSLNGAEEQEFRRVRRAPGRRSAGRRYRSLHPLRPHPLKHDPGRHTSRGKVVPYRTHSYHRPAALMRRNDSGISPLQGSEFVRWVQSSLNQVMGTSLLIDGFMNRATREALQDFQQQQGLPVDGIAGPETKRALIRAKEGVVQREQEQFLESLWGYRARPRQKISRSSSRTRYTRPPARPQPPINRNSPQYIKWLQQSLNRVQGLSLAVDGIAGPMTRSAIRSFQSQHGLAVDGIVGSQTENALIAAGAARPVGGSGTAAPGPPGNIRPGRGQTGGLRFIAIRSTVHTNSLIEQTAMALDAYFARANLPVELTSGVRTPEEQLAIIKKKALDYGLDSKYPAIRMATVDDIGSWLDSWDELLNYKKYIVNPPKPVTSRITGRYIDISPHMKGRAMDLTGPDLDRIAAVVKGYCQQGGAISQILIERNNGAVHVGIGSHGTCAITVS